MPLSPSAPHADNHANIPPLSFLQAGCPSWRQTNSVKALKAKIQTGPNFIKHMLTNEGKVCDQLVRPQSSVTGATTATYLLATGWWATGMKSAMVARPRSTIIWCSILTHSITVADLGGVQTPTLLIRVPLFWKEHFLNMFLAQQGAVTVSINISGNA